MLILKRFEAYSTSDKSNQVLRKYVKLHNFQNVNFYIASLLDNLFGEHL